MIARVDVADVGAGDRALTLMAEVLAASSAVDGQDAVDEATTRRLRLHGLADSSLWLAGEDAFALRHGVELDLVVRPESRGGGVGTALARASVEAAGELLAWSHGDDPAAAALAASLGFARVRELWVMRLGLGGFRGSSPGLLAPQPAEGVTIRGYRPEDADDVVRINAAAFAHHPEQGQMDAADLAERMAEPWFDPAGLLLAEDESGVLGFHWTKRHSETLGEVYVVGIDPAAQGRGLGKALTLAGLAHLAAGGSTDVLLYVEADNLAARAVYEGLGFEHARNDTHVQYHRSQ